MNFENENNAEERRKADQPKADQAQGSGEKRARRAKDKKRGDPELGQALRSIYQRTIDENVPSEMLDLLGKLG